MRARYYDPEVGRFVSEDPVGFESGTVNLYEYAKNNPMNWVDPQGLKVEVCSAPVHVWWVPRFLKHKWLKTSTKEAGMGLVGCGDLVGNPFGKPTQICDHSGRSGSCAEAKCIDETCVNNELIIGKRTGPWGLSNNCWTLVSKILNKCKIKGCCRPNPDLPAL
ncbi:putative deoxyribonuclease RhsC [bacterium BMS3Abin07]|nr:putative deoxyribonuclease RhsC [bacterium BMS3Abin07]